MGVLRQLSYTFKQQLSAALDSDDGAVLSLCKSDYLFKNLGESDYTYLVLGDGVETGTVKVVRSGTKLKVEHIDKPKVWPEGTCVSFAPNQFLFEDMVATAVSEQVGATLQSAVSDSPDLITAEVVDRVLRVKFVGEIPEVPDFCSLPIGTGATYLGCSEEGGLVRVTPPAVSTGGVTVTGGDGVEVSDAGVISLEALHLGYTTNAVSVDEYGRVIDASNVDSGGGDSIFAEGVTLPTGEFTPVFTVTNGIITAVEEGAETGDAAEYDAGAGLVDAQVGNDIVFSLEPTVGSDQSRNGMVFDQYGRLIEIEAPDTIDQRFAKVPFYAFLSADFQSGTTDGFSVLRSYNMTTEEVSRGNTTIVQAFTFDTPAPNDNYVVVDSGTFRTINDVLNKTANGFTVELGGYQTGGEYPCEVLVLGEPVNPTHGTAYPFVPQDLD